MMLILRLFCMVLLKTIEHDVISVTFIFRWLCSCKYRSDSKMKVRLTIYIYSIPELCRSRRAPSQIATIASSL